MHEDVIACSREVEETSTFLGDFWNLQEMQDMWDLSVLCYKSLIFYQAKCSEPDFCFRMSLFATDC